MTGRLGRRLGGLVLAAIAVLAPIAGGPARAADSGTVAVGLRVAAAQVDIVLRADTDNARVGREMEVRAWVRNVGAQAAGPVTVELLLTPQFSITRGANPATLASIAARDTGLASWKVCSRVQGNYVLVARATVATAAGPLEFVSNAEVVGVRLPQGRPRC